MNIEDTRTINEFKKTTFSGYKKIDVMNTVFKSIESKKIENTCHWIIECIISGYTIELWEKLCIYGSKVIHINNTSLPNYIYKQNIVFWNIVNNYNCKKNKNDILYLRNNGIVRNMCISLAIVLLSSSKTKKYKLPKIKNTDFDFTMIQTRLQSPMNLLPENTIHFNEPSELKIIMNEIFVHFKNKVNGYERCIYWICWLFEWEKLNKKKLGGWNIDERNTDIQKKYRCDMIWILWELIHIEIKTRDKFIQLQIESLYKLYIDDYTSGKRNKRIPYILNAVAYLTHNIKKTEIIHDIKSYIQAQINIDKLFEIKKCSEKKNVPIIINSPKQNKNTNKDKISDKLQQFNDIDSILFK